MDSPQRGTYYRWFFFATCIEAAITDRMSPREKATPQSALGYGSFEDTMGTVEAFVKGTRFVLGENFSAADVLLSAQLAYGMMIKAIDPRPAFTDYVARCEDRPGFRRFSEKAAALLK